MNKLTVRLYLDYGNGDVTTWDEATDKRVINEAAGDLTYGGENTLGQPESAFITELDENGRVVHCRDVMDDLYDECEAFMEEYQKELMRYGA